MAEGGGASQARCGDGPFGQRPTSRDGLAVRFRDTDSTCGWKAGSNTDSPAGGTVGVLRQVSACHPERKSLESSSRRVARLTALLLSEAGEQSDGSCNRSAQRTGLGPQGAGCRGTTAQACMTAEVGLRPPEHSVPASRL